MAGPPVTIEATNGSVWASVADYRRAAQAALMDLQKVRDLGPLPGDVIPLVACVKNERTLIDAFMNHYRRLGVGRFLFIDTGSIDGTLEFLAAAPDVELWRAAGSFAKANNGALWADGVLQYRAPGRWILRADADEFLVFAGMKKGIRDLIRSLENIGESRLHAPMLDVYSDRPILQTFIKPEDDPLKICCWFDGVPDSSQRRQNGLWVYGGVRHRLFFKDFPGGPGLTKYPLALYDDQTAYISGHTPTPFDRNFLAPKGRLLHVKLHSALLPRAQWAVVAKQYWNESFEYERYLEVLSANPDLQAHCSISKKYEGPDTLSQAGLI